MKVMHKSAYVPLGLIGRWSQQKDVRSRDVIVLVTWSYYSRVTGWTSYFSRDFGYHWQEPRSLLVIDQLYGWEPRSRDPSLPLWGHIHSLGLSRDLTVPHTQVTPQHSLLGTPVPLHKTFLTQPWFPLNDLRSHQSRISLSILLPKSYRLHRHLCSAKRNVSVPNNVCCYKSKGHFIAVLFGSAWSLWCVCMHLVWGLSSVYWYIRFNSYNGQKV